MQDAKRFWKERNEDAGCRNISASEADRAIHH